MMALLDDSTWSQLVAKSGANGLDLQNNQGLHKLGDASDDTLTRLFSALDAEETGLIGQVELRTCFERILHGFGGDHVDPDAFGMVWAAIHEKHAINAATFAWVIRRLKLELLLTLGEAPPPRQPGEPEHIVFKNQLYDEDVVLKCFDFTRHETYCHVIAQGKLREFYLEPKPKTSVLLRWIVVDSRDTADLLRLGARYGLHPLHVEDCLRLDRQKAKSVTHNDSTFITMPILRLTKQSRKALAGFVEKAQEEEEHGDARQQKGSGSDGVRIEEPFVIRMEQATVGMFIAANNTVITVRTPWRALKGKGSSDHGSSSSSRARTASAARRRKSSAAGKGMRTQASTRRLSQMSLRAPEAVGPPPDSKGGVDGQAASRSAPHLESALDDFFDVDEEGGDEAAGGNGEEDPEDAEMLAAVSETLHHSNITIAGNTPHWLLHGIIDNLVDRLIPIVEAYQTSLHWYQEVLHEDEARFGKVRTKKLMKMKSDLMWLQRKVLLLKPVLKSLLRKVDGDLNLYFQDIDDHLERCSENIGALVTLSQNCMDYVRSHRDQKANQVLLVITVITTVFAPASFLAGVYGMNFATPEGTPTIPELNWKYGYAYFWSWTVVLMAGILIFLRYKLHWSLIRALK